MPDNAVLLAFRCLMHQLHIISCLVLGDSIDDVSQMYSSCFSC